MRKRVYAGLDWCMKTFLKGAFLAGLAVVTLMESGCYTPPPPVAVQAPPPSAVVPPAGYVAYAPDYYVWDGYEYVGVSGGQYVYWTGGTWVTASPVIVGRFNGWERYHPDWRRHAFHYRRGHEPARF